MVVAAVGGLAMVPAVAVAVADSTVQMAALVEQARLVSSLSSGCSDMQKHKKRRGTTREDSIGNTEPQRNVFIFAGLIVAVAVVAFGAIASTMVSGNPYQPQRAILNETPTSIAVSATSSLSASDGVCPVQEKKVTVVGTSLSGFIASGTEVMVLAGYYACHDPKPGDVVIYFYGGLGANDPLIKIVKGIPGDAVSFQKAGSLSAKASATAGAWNILVNGKPLRTTTGIPYAIAGQGFEGFLAYVNAAKGVIPPDEYMILGNLPAGSIDSTKFGFVQKQDLVGKVAE
jgi:signal peptidase I